MKKWWMEATGYQIYPKTFFDANNDGHGDLKGITEKLDYLVELGIDLIWICPFYDSPMDDNGYDVKDYLNVYEKFGTLEDFKDLLKEAKKRGIRIILDLILNHTSDEHPWFLESRKNKNNIYRNYYIWQEGKKDGRPPTNWGSFFGGSAWQYDALTKMYYMKIFSNKMPDLNWKNKKVQQAMFEIAKWWLDLGIDGFRIDALAHLEKAEFIDSTKSQDEIILDYDKFSNLEAVHQYVKKMNDEVFSKYNIVTIGEVGGQMSIDSALKYASFESKELNMVFNFDHNWCNNLFEIDNIQELKVDLNGLKKVFNEWQSAFERKGWLPLNWLNHDQPRVVSQYGNLKYHGASAKMLATVMYLMKGTPFIYQGEEIGMTNYPFAKIEDFNDITSRNRMEEMLKNGVEFKKALFKTSIESRDNARTVMHWDKGLYAGFTKNKTDILVNPNYSEINVLDQMSDEKSIWRYYQELIALRKHESFKTLFIYGKYQQFDGANNQVYAYKREDDQYEALVIGSFSNAYETIKINKEYHKILLNNYDGISLKDNNLILMPYQAIVLLYLK